MPRFQLFPKYLEEAFCTALGRLLGIEVRTTIVFGRFTVLKLVDLLVDLLNATVEGGTS